MPDWKAASMDEEEPSVVRNRAADTKGLWLNGLMTVAPSRDSRVGEMVTPAAGETVSLTCVLHST